MANNCWRDHWWPCTWVYLGLQPARFIQEIPRTTSQSVLQRTPSLVWQVRYTCDSDP